MAPSASRRSSRPSRSVVQRPPTVAASNCTSAGSAVALLHCIAAVTLPRARRPRAPLSPPTPPTSSSRPPCVRPSLDARAPPRHEHVSCESLAQAPSEPYLIRGSTGLRNGLDLFRNINPEFHAGRQGLRDRPRRGCLISSGGAPCLRRPARPPFSLPAPSRAPPSPRRPIAARPDGATPHLFFFFFAPRRLARPRVGTL